VRAIRPRNRGDDRKRSEEMQSFAVEMKGLTKKFGSFTAVSNLDLRIEKGTVHGLLGPNGAGKTTAIKILCGLLKPSGGEGYVLGKKVPNRSVLPEIGYMPQETALYLDLTVHGNLTLYGELFGLSKSRIAEREKVSPLEEVSEIHMSRSFGIDCYTKANGLEVKMGRDSFGEKLRRLSIVWSDLQKRGLSTMSIDCSDLDRIVIKKSHQG